MNLFQFYTYKDEYGIDLSKVETIDKLKFLMSKYRKDLVLNFLSHVGMQLGVGNNLENNIKIQAELLGIPFEKFKIMHLRALLVLYQIFYDIETFNANDKSTIIDPPDVCNLFLLSNHLLDKVEYKTQNYVEGEIPIELLMAAMKMSTDFIGSNDILLQNDLFISFYERLDPQYQAADFNKILIEKTGLNIEDFVKILKKFKNREKHEPGELFKKLEKCMVLKYNDVNSIWKNRIPDLPIPFDYRFPEKYPLILRDNDYYVTSFLLLLRGLILKPYHILSEETKANKTNFRKFFTKEIAEPIIIEHLKEIFVCDEIKQINVKSNNNEFADYGLLSNDDIFLFEIKSVYMGLEIRYTNDAELFKIEFDKRYILNGAGEHQQINQLLNIENNYKEFIGVTGLNKDVNYKIFCIELVFDEVLKCLKFNPFNLYVRDEFNKRIKVDLRNFKNIKPFYKNILITFNELLSLRQKFIQQEKRLLVLKSFFDYEPYSLESFILDLESGKEKLDGISKEDFTINDHT